jgi:hypothetical protein
MGAGLVTVDTPSRQQRCMRWSHLERRCQHIILEVLRQDSYHGCSPLERVRSAISQVLITFLEDAGCRVVARMAGGATKAR